MATSRSISSLDINSGILQALKKARLTDLGNILRTSNQALQALTGLSENDVKNLKDQIAESCITNKNTVISCTGLDLFEATDGKLLQWKLSSRCPEIDRMLRGGVPSGTVTEVTGESASGKTQLCLQLCLSIQNNHQCSGGAVYICTEDAFPSRRLHDMMRHNKSAACGKNLGDNIFVEHVSDFDMLEYCVRHKLPVLLTQRRVRLVVIDSVTAVFRCQFDVSQTMERARHLNSLSASLHKLAVSHNIPIICVNQVSSAMSHGGNTASLSCLNGLTPALGLAWANQITCRLMLSKLSSIEEREVLESQRVADIEAAALWTYRKLCVMFAPHLPQLVAPVYIDYRGIHGFPSRTNKIT